MTSEKFAYSELRFIDTSYGGVQNRNHVVDIFEANDSRAQKDCYTSMFRFGKEYQQLVKKTGSVRGAAEFECWSDYLWFDIDSSDLNFALAHARKLVRGLKPFANEGELVCFFSGSKGFHIGIDAALCGFKASDNLPEMMRRAAVKLARLYDVDIDSKIYNSNRLWRIPDTIHSKTGLYKTLIPLSKMPKITMDGVKKLSAIASKRNAGYLLSYGNTVSSGLFNKLQLLDIPKQDILEDEWESPITVTGSRLEIAKSALEYLLSVGVSQGNRDNEAILRASECRKVHHDRDECLEMLTGWNSLNEPELPEADIERIVESAYSGEGYDFGTNHESLKEAREKAYNDKKNEDIDEDDKKDHVRRPLTFKEITSNPEAGKTPEPIGKWFTWEQRITLLVGSAKLSGKSTLCTYECLDVLAEGKVVLWISNDEPQDDIVRRFLLAGVNRNCENLYIAGNENAPRAWKEIRDFIVQTAPDIVFLDSIHSIFPAVNNGKVPDSSESAEWQKLTAKLRPIARQFNCAIVWIHHANKMGTSAGSIGIAAAVDVIVDLKRVSQRQANCRDLEYLGRFVSSAYNKRLKYISEQEGYEELEFVDTPTANEMQSEDILIERWLDKFFMDDSVSIPSSEMNRKIAVEFGTGDAMRRKVRKIAKSIGIVFIADNTQAPGRIWTKLKKQNPSELTKD